MSKRKVGKEYDKNGYIVHVCPKCGRVLNRIRGEVESIRLYETCPDCKVKLDWSGVLTEPMIQKIEGVFYPMIDGEKIKARDIRFKSNEAVADMETYRHYYNCTFLITPKQKEYFLKDFATQYPSTFNTIVEYMDEHNLDFKTIYNKRILYRSE